MLSIDIINEPYTVVVSNKRPIQVYSNKVMELFRLEQASQVKIFALGAAIPRALKVARFCIYQLKENFNTITSKIIEQSKISITETKTGFGQLPISNERFINKIVLHLVK